MISSWRVMASCQMNNNCWHSLNKGGESFVPHLNFWGFFVQGSVSFMPFPKGLLSLEVINRTYCFIIISCFLKSDSIHYISFCSVCFFYSKLWITTFYAVKCVSRPFETLVTVNMDINTWKQCCPGEYLGCHETHLARASATNSSHNQSPQEFTVSGNSAKTG